MSVGVAAVANAAGRRVWRLGLRLKYLLLQRHRHDRLVLEEPAGLPIVVLPGVFNPRLFWTGEFLAGCLLEQRATGGAHVLDMGTGTGIGAIAAAPGAANVVAVDINPAAVRCARINTLLHCLEDRIEIREGDLFGPVAGERFDLVLFNPPYHAGVARDELDRAFHGADVAERFAAALPHHLRPGGAALVLLSSLGEESHFIGCLAGAGMDTRLVAERRLVGEVLRIYRVTDARGADADPV